jgi:hypothetical protein
VTTFAPACGSNQPVIATSPLNQASLSDCVQYHTKVVAPALQFLDRKPAEEPMMTV